MVSRISAKTHTNGPYWYQFLPVSIVLHLGFFGLYCVCVPDTAAWQVFAVQTQEERQIVPFREAVIEWADVADFVETTEAVSPDEDPFDEPPVEMVQPNIVFQVPNVTTDARNDESNDARNDESNDARNDESNDARNDESNDESNEKEIIKNILKNQNETNDIVTDFDNSSSESLDGASETQHASDLVVQRETSGAGGAGDSRQSGERVDLSNSITTSGAKEGGSDRQVDEKAVWKEYEKQLTEYLKKYHHYPEMARRRRLTGTVWLLVEVRRNGSLISAEIATSSGVSMLDDAALSAVKDAVPLPPFPQNTTAETKKLRIPYTFKLKG